MIRLLKDLFLRAKGFILGLFAKGEAREGVEAKGVHNNGQTVISKALCTLAAGDSIKDRAKALEAQLLRPESLRAKERSKPEISGFCFGVDKNALSKYKKFEARVHRNRLNLHKKNKVRGHRRWSESKPVHIRELKL
jgi:hypothetical protein